MASTLPDTTAAAPGATDRRTTCPMCLATGPRFQRRQTGFDVSRCGSCGGDFAVLSQADLPSYDDHYSAGSIYTGYHELMAKAKSERPQLYWYQPRMIETAGPGQGRVHLDIGSGLGTFPAVTRSKGWTSYGLDVSPAAAKTAMDALGIPTFVGGIEAVDLPPGGVHWISAFEVMEHVLEPRAYAARFHQLLADGGLVTISVPNGRSRSEQTSTDPLVTPPTHVNYFTRRGLARMMNSHGFDTVYDYEKPFAWAELNRPRWQRFALLPLLVADALLLGNRGNRLLWVGRKAARTRA